jgi:hypothetical protein
MDDISSGILPDLETVKEIIKDVGQTALSAPTQGAPTVAGHETKQMDTKPEDLFDTLQPEQEQPRSRPVLVIPSEEVTVPVVIDAVDVSFNISRAIYFSFEAVDPAAGWSLTVEDCDVPFFMLGISGVILGAALLGRPYAARFLDPEWIENTFLTIERSGVLAVVTARLWLPTSLLRLAKEEIARQDVFRLRKDVFASAHLLAIEMMPAEKIERHFEPYYGEYHKSQDPTLPGPLPVKFSKEETAAFQQWTQLQIEQAAAHYREQVDSQAALNHVESHLEPF